MLQKQRPRMHANVCFRITDSNLPGLNPIPERENDVRATLVLRAQSNTHLLCNSVYYLLRVSIDGKRKDASIYDSHVRESVYTEPGVDDT